MLTLDVPLFRGGPTGYSSIWSLPISLISSAIYTESFWQRVWAAESPQVLRKAGFWSCILTTIVIAFFGFVGFLGLWAQLPPLDDFNNLAFFVPFQQSSAFGVVLVVLAATMNESAVDSLQNAIVATLASNFLVGKPVWWPRLLTFVINIPVMFVALHGLKLLDIFLVLNVITTFCLVPLMAGLWSTKLSGITVTASIVLSLICTIGFGVLHVGNFSEGVKWTFSSELNFYDYRIFLVAFLSSVVFVVIGLVTIDRNGKYVVKGALAPSQDLKVASSAPPANGAGTADKQRTGISGLVITAI